MVHLKKEIENDKKWNEKKLGPCMYERIHLFWPYSTLDLFHPKQWLQNRSNIKEIETWKVANGLGKGKTIKKLPMLKANSVLRAKNKANADQVIWLFELTKFQPSCISSEQKGKQQEKRIITREKNKVSV